MSDYIPQEILVLILKLLPVKSLLRFRCVSKRWKEFIDSPTLTLDHLAHQKPRFLLKNGDSDLVVVDPLTLPSPFPLVDTLTPPIEGRFYFFGTLHGLVCLYDGHGRNLLLWNPSIHKFSTLPLPLDLDLDWDWDWDWVFGDASKTCFGFWTDPSNREFKIIIICFNFAESMDYGILYSSIRQDWSEIHPWVVARDWMPWTKGAALMLGGVAHWGGESFHIRRFERIYYEFLTAQGLVEPQPKSIMCYDFSQESFELIVLPNLKYISPVYPRLFHWQGMLSVLCWDKNFAHSCEIYSRQEGSWVNMYCVNLIYPIERVYWVLGGMEERVRALASTYEELVLYDTEAGCIPLMGGLRYVDVAYGFVESLLFPNLG